MGSKKNPLWLWNSVSFYTSQVLSLALGARDLETARRMWAAVPPDYQRKQAHTDEYLVYEYLFPWSKHWQCPKGSGATNVVDGVNNALRQRVSYLGRKTASFARNPEWLWRRLLWTVYHRNLKIKNRILKTKKAP